MVISTRGRRNNDHHCFSAWTKNFIYFFSPLLQEVKKQKTIKGNIQNEFPSLLSIN